MHPHTLLRMSLVVSVAFIVCFALSGCGKQQKVAPAKMPQVSKESAAAADTADIFKEFYSEDSATKKSKKGAQQETFSPSASSSSFQPEFSANGRYTVQITCVRSRSFADGMAGKMKDKGYPAYVAEVQNPTPDLSGTFYRVRIGGIGGLSAAKSFGENILVPSGYEYWVDKKSNDNVGMEGYGLGSGSAGSNAASSYDNAPPAVPASSYQSAPATTSSSYESSNNTYSSPSSSTSSYENSTTSSATASSPATGSAASTADAGASTSGSPASSSTASNAPAGTPSGSATGTTGSTTGKASTGSSTESGWGTDSASKSGW